MKKVTATLLLAIGLLTPARVLADGPYGGSITELTRSADKTPEYAATTRGLFRMVKGRWQRIESLGTGQLTAFAATPKTLLAAIRSKGVHRSIDGGLTWSQTTEGLKSRFGAPVDDVTTIVYDRREKALYLGTAGKGILRSTDEGETWKNLVDGMEALGPAGQHIGAVLPGDPKRPLLLGTDGEGLLVQKEDKWVKTCAGLPEKARISSLVADEKNPEHLLLGTVFDGLWESPDSGATCKQVYKGQFGVVSAVAIGADGGLAAYFGQDGLYVLRPETRARPVNLGYMVVRALHETSDGGYVLATVNDGLLTADKSGKLTGEINQGLDATTIKSIHQDDTAKALWVGDLNGVFHTTDDGTSWRHRDRGLITGECSAFTRLGADLYLGTGGQGVFRWNEEKTEWEFRGRALGTSNTIYSMEKTSAGRIYVGTEGGVLWTENGGEDWTRVGAGIEITARTTVATDPENPQRVLAANTKALYESLDSGQSWKNLATGPYGGVKIENGEIWARTPKKLVRIKNGEPETLFDAGGATLHTHLATREGIWIGTDQGLWSVSGTAKKLQWSEAGVTSLAIQGGELIVGTDGRGVKTFKIE